MVCGFAGLILLGYFALIVLNPKTRPWATSKESSTSLKAINQNLPIPAQAIGKTKAVVVVPVANAPRSKGKGETTLPSGDRRCPYFLLPSRSIRSERTLGRWTDQANQT